MSNPEMRGIIPKSFEHVFRTLGSNTDPNKQFMVRCSYLEIYNEEIRDLLSKDPEKHLDLREDADHSVYVKDLTTVTVKTATDMVGLVAEKSVYLSKLPQRGPSTPPLLCCAVNLHAVTSLEPLSGAGRNAELGVVITGAGEAAAVEQVKSFGGLDEYSRQPLTFCVVGDGTPAPEQPAAA